MANQLQKLVLEAKIKAIGSIYVALSTMSGLIVSTTIGWAKAGASLEAENAIIPKPMYAENILNITLVNDLFILGCSLSSLFVKQTALNISMAW